MTGRRARWCAAAVAGTVTLYVVSVMAVMTVWQHQLEDWQEALDAVLDAMADDLADGRRP